MYICTQTYSQVLVTRRINSDSIGTVYLQLIFFYGMSTDMSELFHTTERNSESSTAHQRISPWNIELHFTQQLCTHSVLTALHSNTTDTI